MSKSYIYCYYLILSFSAFLNLCIKSLTDPESYYYDKLILAWWNLTIMPKGEAYICVIDSINPPF